jgi:glycine cleavage system H protein
VLERNQAALDRPELVSGSPYGEGWLLKVALKDRTELDRLMTADQYDRLLASEDH